VCQNSHPAKPQLITAKAACFAQIDEVARRLARTRDLVAGANVSRDAFQHSLTEVQEGFLGAELDLAIALYEFERAMEEEYTCRS
jgi:hypothetical protein